MKFKVGDKVKVVKQQEGLEDYQIPVGSVGEVLEVDGSDTVGLAYFVKSSSFMGGCGVNRDTWWFEEDNLELVSNESQDVVNSPNHYTSGSIECIDAMQASLPPEQFKGFLRGNVQKYCWRCDKKNGVEDLKKARWYLDKLIETIEKEQGSCTE